MNNTLGKTTRIMLLSYLGLLTLAGFFYGGGNYVDKTTPYYNFFRNFISDLGRTTSHSGEDNTISIILFSIGMLIQLIAVLIYLVKAANYFAKDYPKISILAKCSAIFGSFSLLGVIVTPADVPSLYALHIFFANSVFNGAFVTLGIYSYLFAIIIGGSLGNLFDRIYYYAVPDFIDLHFGNFHWFIFNVADIFITVGIIGLIFFEIFKKEKVYKDA